MIYFLVMDQGKKKKPSILGAIAYKLFSGMVWLIEQMKEFEVAPEFPHRYTAYPMD